MDRQIIQTFDATTHDGIEIAITRLVDKTEIILVVPPMPREWEKFGLQETDLRVHRVGPMSLPEAVGLATELVEAMRAKLEAFPAIVEALYDAWP